VQLWLAIVAGTILVVALIVAGVLFLTGIGLAIFAATRPDFDLYDDDDEGASLVEYALLVALIALVCISAIAFVGSSVSSKLSNVSTAFTTDAGSPGS
jgi:pilus assembly protein Flp/PilA